MPLPAPLRLRSPRLQFLNAVKSVTGNTARLILLADGQDVTAVRDESGLGHAFTQNASVQGRLTRQGAGWMWSYLTASSQYADTPDAADLSFGTGAADLPMSVVAFHNVTDTAAVRCILAKYQTSNGEWGFEVTSTDNLQFFVADQSAGVLPERVSDAAVIQGTPALVGASYSGAGGATAMNGVTLYQNGALIASTATNNASYVAMEPLAAPAELGTLLAHTTNLYSGGIGFVMVCAAALTAAQHAALAMECRRYFGVAL